MWKKWTNSSVRCVFHSEKNLGRGFSARLSDEFANLLDSDLPGTKSRHNRRFIAPWTSYDSELDLVDQRWRPTFRQMEKKITSKPTSWCWSPKSVSYLAIDRAVSCIQCAKAWLSCTISLFENGSWFSTAGLSSVLSSWDEVCWPRHRCQKKYTLKWATGRVMHFWCVLSVFLHIKLRCSRIPRKRPKILPLCWSDSCESLASSIEPARRPENDDVFHWSFCLTFFDPLGRVMERASNLSYGFTTSSDPTSWNAAGLLRDPVNFVHPSETATSLKNLWSEIHVIPWIPKFLQLKLKQ